MNYRSVSDLNDLVVRWARVLPGDIELVVGIPRSGLLVANLLSMYLNLPMTDVDGLLSGRVLRSGARYRGDRGGVFFGRSRKVLIVDDSVSYGGQMAKVRGEIAAADLPHSIQYGAVYISPEARDERLVDHFGEVLPRPRVFEWNLMHHESLLARCCVSLEGVVCPPLPGATGRDGEGSRMRIQGMKPVWVPDYPVGCLISTAPDADRAETAAWLASHGVEYTRLVMRGENEGWSERQGEKDVWYKAEIYESSGADLLLEGSLDVSCRVAALIGKPVYCITTREMIRPGMSSTEGRRIRSPLAWWAVQRYHRTVRIPRLAARRLVSRLRRHASREKGRPPFPAEPDTGPKGVEG
ncbi:MAG: phosphoribosyltransferase [Gemmatimonadales bacterium]|nr:MAG: phosphoribosyltransferase [Gemmatimonadales bacterium]